MPVRIRAAVVALIAILTLVAVPACRDRAAAVQQGIHTQVVNLVLRQDELQPNTINVQSGLPVELIITATDGDYEVEIPRLLTPVRVAQNQSIAVNLTVPESGEFPIVVQGPSGRLEGRFRIDKPAGRPLEGQSTQP